MSDLYCLTDEQMARLQPFSFKSHGRPRVDDRRVLNGIVFVNHNGLRWRDGPSAYGPHKTLYNRWKRWSERGVFLRMSGLSGELPRLRMCDAGVVLTATNTLMAEIAQDWPTSAGQQLIGLLFSGVFRALGAGIA